MEAEADAFAAKMDAAKGYPNPATKTERYSEVVKHPTQKLWTIAAGDESDLALALGERAALKPFNKAFFPDQVGP